MEEKLVTVAEFADSMEVNLAKQLLADYEIESVISGEHAADLYTVPAIGLARLQTLESQAKRAREILASSEQQED